VEQFHQLASGGQRGQAAAMLLRRGNKEPIPSHIELHHASSIRALGTMDFSCAECALVEVNRM
jgi:hypothetical protein